MTLESAPEPWRSLLAEIDSALEQPAELHSMGGFVLQVAYGLTRTTVDLDFLYAAPLTAAKSLEQLAGKGSTLHGKYKVYLQYVPVLEAYPENYADRILPLFPAAFRNLQLYALEPHDLALTKLGRDSERDRADITLLARAGLVTSAVLNQRYRNEMRSYLSNPDRYDLTLRLWSEIINEASGSRPSPAH